MSTIEEGIRLQQSEEWAKAIEVLPGAIEAARAEGNEVSALEGQLALAAAQLELDLEGDPAHATYTDLVGRAAEHTAINARTYFEFGMKASDPALVDYAISLWNGLGDDESIAWAARAVASAAALRDNTEGAAMNYQLAIPTLRGQLGVSDPRLLAVFDEAVAFFEKTGDADAAKKERDRAFIVACINFGPVAPATLRTMAAVAKTDIETGLRCYDQCIQRAGDDATALGTVWWARGVALEASDPTEALRNKETGLGYSEQGLGILDYDLIPKRKEIEEGWTAAGNSEEAEAFVRRCRERAPAESWLYRNLTINLGYTMMYAQRRDEYAQLWRDFIAAREAVCAPDSAEVVEAVQLAAEKLPHYAPAEELAALAARLGVATKTRESLNALAAAERAAGRRDEARAAWKRAIDLWIEDLGKGTIDFEPAVGAWSQDYGAWGSFPPSGPPTEEQLGAIAVYDDALARAVAVVGDDQPALAKMFRSRGAMMSMFSIRPDDALVDLTRARTLFERAGETYDYCYTLYELSDHHDRYSSRDVAIAALRECIAARLAANDFEGYWDKRRLAEWLVRRAGDGDVAEAIEIRNQLVGEWASGAPGVVAWELEQLSDLHIEQHDLASATATCERFAGAMESAGESDRYHAVDGWWKLLRAKCDAEDLDGARAAADAIVALWSWPELTGKIQEKADDARERELPVADYFREQVIAKAFAGIDKSRELEGQIAPAISDETAPVLADALIASGDPRGELITVQQKLASAPDDGELLERQRQILASHRMRMLGPLEESNATWRLGYWKTLELPGFPMRLVMDLRSIVEHPSARYLEAITFKDMPQHLDLSIISAADALKRIPSVQMTRLDDSVRVSMLKAAIPGLEFVDD